jgi:hypothetical protein
MRKYRGWCMTNEHLDAAIAKFNAVRPAIEALFAGAELDARSLKSTTDYIAEFYETINDAKLRQRQIIDECRVGGG